jgi:predicted transcriptional regulator
MNYLSKEDLVVIAYERFIDESSENEEIINELEKRAIAYLKTVLGTRYNVEFLFAEAEPVRNELIVQILSYTVVYNLFKRNAARKLPSTFKDDYDNAMKLLKDVATGVIKLDGVPVPTDGSGNPIKSNTMFGNLKNDNFYI